MESKLLDCLSDVVDGQFLGQHITSPTHVEGGVLDLVFCNNSRLLASAIQMLIQCNVQFHVKLVLCNYLKREIALTDPTGWHF